MTQASMTRWHGGMPSEPTMGITPAHLMTGTDPSIHGDQAGPRRELKVYITVTTDLPEHRVRALANRYAELLADAVGSKPVKANVTPVGKQRRGEEDID